MVLGDEIQELRAVVDPAMAPYLAVDDLRLDVNKRLDDVGAAARRIQRQQRTLLLAQVNQAFNQGQLVLSLRDGAGILNSFTLVSPVSDFGITFIVDGIAWFDNRAFSDFQTISPHVQNIVARALTDGSGNFAISLYNVRFFRSLSLQIARLASGPKTFPVVAAVADVDEGVIMTPPPGFSGTIA